MALSRSPLVVQFLKFGVVGTIGFLVDTATVYTLRFALGLYIAGYVSYVVGASTDLAAQPHLDVSRPWRWPSLPSMDAIPGAEPGRVLYSIVASIAC